MHLLLHGSVTVHVFKIGFKVYELVRSAIVASNRQPCTDRRNIMSCLNTVSKVLFIVRPLDIDIEYMNIGT